MPNYGKPPRRWLLLRGMAREVRHWGPFPQELQKRFPQSEVHCLDLPGAGTQYQTSCPTTVSRMMHEVRDRWFSLGTPTECDAILGLSLGGMITLQWISEHPKEFAYAFVLNSSAGGVNAPFRRLQPSALATFLKIAASRSVRRKEQLILELTNFRQFPEAELERRVEIAQTAPVSLANSVAQMMAGARFRAPKISGAQLTLIRSLKDRLCHPECSRELSQHYGAPLWEHPESGHDLPVDSPQWLADALSKAFSG